MPTSDQGVQPGRYQLIPRVLVFISSSLGVLLIKGAPTKRIWPNKYNGIGGHVELGEDIVAAAVREVYEETGLPLRSPALQAIITVDTGVTPGIVLFVFTSVTEQLQTVAGSEGGLEWVPIEQLYQRDLVEDLRSLLPKILGRSPAAQPLVGHYNYDSSGNLVVRLSGSEP